MAQTEFGGACQPGKDKGASHPQKTKEYPSGRLHCFEKIVMCAFRWPGKITPELLRKHGPADILDSGFQLPQQSCNKPLLLKAAPFATLHDSLRKWI